MEAILEAEIAHLQSIIDQSEPEMKQELEAYLGLRLLRARKRLHGIALGYGF